MVERLGLVGLAVAACVAPAHAQLPPAAPAPPGPTPGKPAFLVERIAGLERLGGETVQYESGQPDAARPVLSTAVRFGGLVFEVSRDLEDGAFVIDGHGSTVTAGVKRAAADLLRKLEGVHGPRPGNEVQQHEALLLGYVKWLASARVGMRIPRRVLAGKRPRAVPEAYGFGSDLNLLGFARCTDARPGDQGAAYICPYGVCGEVRYAFVNRTGGADSNCRGDGCVGKNPSLCGNWECQGQCGVGCHGFDSGVYQDCFEHDVCTDYYPDDACDLDKFFAVPAFIHSYSGTCRE